MALAMAGCGGGGGGGSDGPGTAPTPPPSTGTSPGAGSNPGATGATLKFNASNAGRVAGYPLWATEGLMRLGNALSDDVVATMQRKKVADSGSCQGGTGTWNRTFQDNDGSGAVSAGDVITMQFAGCHREPLARMVDGTASVKINSVDGSGGFVAVVTVALPGMGVSATVGDKTTDFRMSGTMRLAWSPSDTRTTLTLGDGASDEVLFDIPWMSIAGDRVSAFKMEKRQHWDEARSYLDLRMRYASPELGGSFDVSTPVGISSWLDTLPEARPGQGWLLMQGAAKDEVRIDVISTGGTSPEIGVKVDFGGDGVLDMSGDARWTDAGLISGYFFADYTAGGRGNTYALDPNELSLRAPFRASTTVAVQDTLRLQFTRPPVGSTGWTWRLMDKGPLPGGTGTPQEVPVTVQTLGALVLIKPAQPLRYSRQYELLLDTGAPSAQGQLLRATTGGTLDLYKGVVGGFQTLDYLNPRPAFYKLPQYLSATQNTRVGTFAQPAGAPAVTYRWTQVSGQPVVIAAPTAAETDIALGAGAAGIGSATLRLTMALADGTSESADIVIRTVHDTALAWSSLIHVKPTNFTLPEQFIWGGPAVGQLQVARSSVDSLTLQYSDRAGPASQYPDWSLRLRSADGSALRPGQYTNAWSPAAAGKPDGVPLLEFDMRQIGFMPWGSDFTVRELETDASGTVTKLALDFVVRGVGDYTPITGSVRLNSVLPLVP
ncbi:hypothetical protein [Roseateles sp. LKC17W]|uniref:Lipoprotein n=1 Tax=Pelomonas margarita TaxID=3299031 RepID=A0ABW7FPA0_9BURK